MKTINTPKGEILVVKVPSDSTDHSFEQGRIVFKHNIPSYPNLTEAILVESGDWKILGTVNKKGECSEEDMRRFIEHIGLSLVKIVNFLLEANGLYINNPFNDPEQDFYKRDLAEESTLQENECYLVLIKK